MKAAEEQKNERKHKRYNLASDAFALLKWNGAEVLGSIIDISKGGLSVSHIDNNEDLEALARITVNLISEKVCCENFIGRSIWIKKEEGAFTSARVQMKQCGIEFGQINEENQVQLKEFIDSLKK